MQGELSIPLSLLHGFSFTLARVAGVFTFVPIPGNHSGPIWARVILSLALTFALVSSWPRPDGISTPAELAAGILSEAVFGIAAGLLVGLTTDALLTGAQALSMPAGYGYASAFDPNTNADSGVLVIFTQLMAGMLFFSLGFDRYVIRAFAASMEACPPGTFVATPAMATELIRLAGTVFSLAVRLAMPIVGLLLLVDFAMGVLGRLAPQIQIVSLAFPVKMLLSLLLLASTLTVMPRIFERHGAQMIDGMKVLLVRN